MSPSFPPFLPRRGRAVALAAAVAVAASVAPAGQAHASAKSKTARLIEPKVVATYSKPTESDRWTVYQQANWLLRPDGSFGYFTRVYGPHETVPLELVSFGGPVTAGTFRKQAVDGALGGSLPYPGVTASGIEGYDWIFDHAVSGDGGSQIEPSLVAIDDLGNVAKRVSLNAGPSTITKALVPTGVGLRAVIDATGTGSGLEVRRSDGTLLADVPQLSDVRATFGNPDGSLLLTGPAQERVADNWGRSIVKVSAQGKITRLHTRGSRGPLITGDPLAKMRGGVLLARPQAYWAKEIARLSPSGKLLRRKLSQLRLPWSESCDESKQLRLDWATTGPSGDPIVGVTCFDDGDRIGYDVESFSVGLDSKLRAKWAAPGTLNAAPRVGPDGRLYTTTNSQLFAFREPGAGKPRRGRVVSVTPEGDTAVVAIRCIAPEGTVCAGTARLSRDGTPGTIGQRYALRGRPGPSAALIFRHFDGTLPAGDGELRVTLGR